MKKRIQFSGRLAVPALTLLMMSAMGMTALAARGWVVENNEWRYINNDGSYATDCFKRSGNDYYYLDWDGSITRSQIIDDGSNIYYVNSAGAMVKNLWRLVDNTERHDSEEPDSWWYYLGANGRALRRTGDRVKISVAPTASGNAKFIFDDMGHTLSGWIGEDGQMLYGEDAWRDGLYYADPDNGQRLVVNGWAYIEAENPDDQDRNGDGYWFFFDGSGKKVTDKASKLINGRKYRFNEYGAANYDWYMDASGSTVSSYYYSTEEKCYLKTGWFKAVPDPDVDPEGWSNGDEYWYYADKKGQTAKSVIKNINGLRYGFDEFGKMLNGLYELEMADDGVTILDARYIETIDELPTDEGALVYYFGNSPKAGVLKTGNATIKLDGETFAYKFKKGGTYKGAGTNGISDGCIYINGRRMEASDELRYEPFEYNGKEYLISSLGRIIKNKKNARDTDGYYYCTDKEGVIIYEGDEKFEA